ncbi:MAG: alpha/beta fold hydrolase, partial [Leptospiraceae bacterium]|nr:alpha/beta fold hydrolase [Leptospiraceae bacterium]
MIVLLASHAWIYWRHSPDAYGQPHLNSPAARAAIDPESDRTAGFVAVPRYQPDGPINPAPPVIIHYEDWHRSQADKKEILILLHGSPGRVGSFRSLVPELNKDLYAIAPDLPGFGRSTREIPNYGIRAQARYMLAFMDALGIQSAHFWAYSMSSGIVLEMSRMAPDRIESAIFYGGIGIQAGEGSGDYTIEHLKYRAGYVCFYLLPELIPHFGLIPDRSYRHSFIRNFMDTDQRPLRTALENFPAPLLILHGVRDPLVLPWVAEEHHRLAPHSQLVMLPGSHFLIFHTDGVHVLAAETNRFLRELQQSQSIKEFTHYEARPDAEIELPLDLSIEPGSAISAWTRLLGIISGTFVSEDLTCISVGLLIRARQLDFFTGLLGCYVGIFLGDVGLYFLGVMVRLGLLRWRKAAALLQHDRLQGLADRFDREGWKLIIMSRFLPGTRFPVYTGAGLIGGHATRLILFALIAGLLWTPLLVLLTAFYGAGILELANQVFGVGWLALACTLIVLYLMVRAALMLLSTEGRYRLWARLERLRRPEFWPPLLFYAPLIPVVAYLIVRYRGFESVAAVNPGIEDGGFIGESKAAILKRLPAEVVPDFVLIPVGTVLERMQAIDTHIRKRGWTFPLIVKPDAAQRGVGLRLVRNRQEIVAYLPDHPLPLVLQVYHPGPYEAGVFYVRHPNEVRGRIFSITDKVFPILIG